MPRAGVQQRRSVEHVSGGGLEVGLEAGQLGRHVLGQPPPMSGSSTHDSGRAKRNSRRRCTRLSPSSSTHSSNPANRTMRSIGLGTGMMSTRLPGVRTTRWVVRGPGMPIKRGRNRNTVSAGLRRTQVIVFRRGSTAW